MNLALITQDFSPEVGGIETYANELAQRFAKECSNFLVIAPDKPGAEEVDKNLPFHVERIAGKNTSLGPLAFPNAPLLFQKYGIDHAFHTQWQTLPLSVFAQQRGVIKNIFVAAHARELLFDPFEAFPVASKMYHWYKRWILSKVDLFFPVSEYTGDLLLHQNIPKNKIEVVINGTDPQKFYPSSTRAARQLLGLKAEKIILTITRLVSRKGIDTTLKAFNKIVQNHADSHYVIVGEGPYEKKLKQLATRLGINNSVHFVGRVPYDDLIHYYNACDVFVMPSKTELPNVEGFGIVFLEANACSKPVIGSFSGGIPSAILDGETGMLVPEQQPDALANAIETIFANPERFKKMGAVGRKRVEEVANWDHTATKIMNFMTDKI